MLVKKYRSKVLSVINPLEELFTVELESLTGRFKYNPGQFLHLALDSNYDGCDQWPDSRCFSMQSSPDENKIRITYAVKGRFTRLMKSNLRPGSEVWLKLPYGNLFCQNHNKRNTVFIAGGTGITPFLSLFKHQAFNDYFDPRIYLGFKSETFNIYKDFLNALNPKKLVIYYEDVQGVLNINRIFNENKTESDYFISGPPQMISMFKHFLISHGVLPSKILTDEWE